MKQKQFVVTRDAIFASTINHLIAIYIGFEEEKTPVLRALDFALTILMPKTTNTENDRMQAMYVMLVARMTDKMELEAQALQLLIPAKKNTDEEKLLNLLVKMDFSQETKDESALKSVAPLLLTLMQCAGVKDIETAFTEMDCLAMELEDNPAGRFR